MGTKYKIVYDDLVRKIEDEQFLAGDILPSEKELMKIYNVSRDTIRKSLNLLCQNGYIIKEKGKGSIVLENNKFEFPISGLTSFKELKENLGEDVKTKVVCLELMEADHSNQKRLNLNQNDKIWYIERVRIVNNEAIILDTDIINAQMVPNLTVDILEDSLYRYIEEELKMKIGFARKEITVQQATNNDKKNLDIKDYDMLVNVKSYVYLENGQVFQYTDSHHRPDKFRFVDFARRNHNI